MVQIVVKASGEKIVEFVQVENGSPKTVAVKVHTPARAVMVYLSRDDAVAVRDALAEAIKQLK